MEWVGISALVVSAATLYLVVKQEQRQRRHAPYVKLSLYPLGQAHKAQTGELVSHIWELVNEGTAAARLGIVHGVGCEIEYSDEHPPIKILKGTDSRRLIVKPCDVEQAWVLIGWTSPHVPDWHYVEWLAPDPSPQLEAALNAAHAPWQMWLRWVRPMWLRRRLYSVRAVGPGGAAKVCVPAGRRRTGRQLRTALSLAAPEKALAAIDRML